MPSGFDPTAILSLLMRLRDQRTMEAERAEQNRRYEESFAMKRRQIDDANFDQLLNASQNPDAPLKELAQELGIGPARLKIAQSVQKQKKAEREMSQAEPRLQLSAQEAARGQNVTPQLAAEQQQLIGSLGAAEAGPRIAQQQTAFDAMFRHQRLQLAEEERLARLAVRDKARQASAQTAATLHAQRPFAVNESLSKLYEAEALGDMSQVSVREELESRIRSSDLVHGANRIAEARFAGAAGSAEERRRRELGQTLPGLELQSAQAASDATGRPISEVLAERQGYGYQSKLTGEFVWTVNEKATNGALAREETFVGLREHGRVILDSAQDMVDRGESFQGFRGTQAGALIDRFFGKEATGQGKLLFHLNRYTVRVARLYQDNRISDTDLAFALQGVPRLGDVFAGPDGKLSDQFMGRIQAMEEFLDLVARENDPAARQERAVRGQQYLMDPETAERVRVFKESVDVLDDPDAKIKSKKDKARINAVANPAFQKRLLKDISTVEPGESGGVREEEMPLYERALRGSQ